MTEVKKKCEGITEQGTPCTRYSKVIYEGQNFCKMHYKKTKANENCPICLDTMGKRDRVDVCGYGHFYHKQCVEQCRNMCVCPTCNRQMTVNTCFKVFEEASRERRRAVYSLEPLLQKSISKAEDALLKCANHISTDELDAIGICLDDITGKHQDVRYTVINIIHQLLVRSSKGDPLEGVIFMVNNGAASFIDPPND